MRGHLFSGSAGDTAFTASPGVVGPHVVSALDEGVVDSTDEHRLLRATSATDVTQLREHVSSPVSADGFSLSATRIVYADDQPDNSAVSVHSRHITTANHRVRLRPARLVSDSPRLDSAVVAAEDDWTVSATRDPADDGYDDLTVHTGDATRTLRSVRFGAFGGHWLQYVPKGGVPRRTLLLDDVRSGRSVRVRTPHPVHGKVAISGGSLFYQGSDRFYREHIASGRTALVGNPHCQVGSPSPIAAYGHYVAWTAFCHRNGHAPYNYLVSRLEDLDRPAKRATLTHVVTSMGPAGVVLSGSDLVAFGSGRTTVWLRPYAGRQHTVLSRRYLTGLPQTAGHLFAWPDLAGVLRLRRL